jgi:hypothetical protein
VGSCGASERANAHRKAPGRAAALDDGHRSPGVRSRPSLAPLEHPATYRGGTPGSRLPPSLVGIVFTSPFSSASSRPPSGAALKEADDFTKDAEAVAGKSAMDRFRDKMRSTETVVAFRVWGWSTGAGILGLIVALFMIAAIVVSFFVSVVRPWSWIGSFLWSVFTLVLLILALVWILGSPGLSNDVTSAGISFGPFVTLAAALIILPAGVLDGTVGLRAFIASVKSRRIAIA